MIDLTGDTPIPKVWSITSVGIAMLGGISEYDAGKIPSKNAQNVVLAVGAGGLR